MDLNSPRIHNAYYVYNKGIFYESWYGHLEETSDFLLDLLLPHLAEIPFPVIFQFIGPKPDDGDTLKHIRTIMVHTLEASPCDFVLQVQSLLKNNVLAFPFTSIYDHDLTISYEQYKEIRPLISSRSERLDFLRRVFGALSNTVIVISINSELNSPSYYLQLLCPEYALLSKSHTKPDSCRIIDLRPVNKAVITDKEVLLPEINLRISTSVKESSALYHPLLTF